jgi:hypothetical protein
MSENTDRNESSEPDFRSIGFSDYARHFPRDAAGVALLAAFNNVRPDQLTEAMMFYPNEATKAAWERVASAAEQFFAERCAEICDENASFHLELASEMKQCEDAENARHAINEARVAAGLASAIRQSAAHKPNPGASA